MHAQHRHTGVNGVNVAVGHELGDRAAAALIDLAHLGQLPDDAVVGKQAAQIGHELGRGVACAGLAARARELADAHAVVELGLRALGAHLGEAGVKGRADVRREAKALGKAVAQRDVLLLAEVGHEGLKRLRLHAGHAVGADLFFIGEDTHGRALRRAVKVEDGAQLGIGAHAVVLTVGADHAAVKADVARRERRHGGQLRRQEVLLRDAVFIIEQGQHGELHTVAPLAGIRHAADDDVECLARDALFHGLAHLILAEVRQQIGDDKLRLVRLAADGDIDRAAVLERDGAVQLQRDRDPLVLLDAAVIVRLEIRQLRVLVHRRLLEIKARRVDVRARDHAAVVERLLTEHGQHERLAAVVDIHLRARLQLHAERIRHEARVLRHADRFLDGLALGACGVEKLLISLSVGKDLPRLLGVDLIVTILRLVKQLFLPLLEFLIFAHESTSCIS